MAANKHKRNMSLHYSAVALIVLIIFAVLSTTVFFNIETALVTGSSIYSADEIISVSGIRGGDNIIRENLGKAEQAITSELIYIETAEITRRLPSAVEITVVPCTETASLQGEDGFMIVSGMGKILRFSEEPAEGTQIFYGADPAESLETGMTFASSEEAKTEVIYELMKMREASSFAEKVTSYDVRDRLNISCIYDGRIEVEIGVITDADYKFKLAGEILTSRVAPDAEGRLKIFDKAGQFLSKSDLEQIDEVYEHNLTSETAPPAPESTDGSDGSGANDGDTGGSTETNQSTKLNFE